MISYPRPITLRRSTNPALSENPLRSCRRNQTNNILVFRRRFMMYRTLRNPIPTEKINFKFPVLQYSAPVSTVHCGTMRNVACIAFYLQPRVAYCSIEM